MSYVHLHKYKPTYVLLDMKYKQEVNLVYVRMRILNNIMFYEKCFCYPITYLDLITGKYRYILSLAVYVYRIKPHRRNMDIGHINGKLRYKLGRFTKKKYKQNLQYRFGKFMKKFKKF